MSSVKVMVLRKSSEIWDKWKVGHSAGPYAALLKGWIHHTHSVKKGKCETGLVRTPASTIIALSSKTQNCRESWECRSGVRHVQELWVLIKPRCGTKRLACSQTGIHVKCQACSCPKSRVSFTSLACVRFCLGQWAAEGENSVGITDFSPNLAWCLVCSRCWVLNKCSVSE